MENLLFHHEYSDGQCWYDEQACLDDFFEHLPQEEVFDTITCLHGDYEIIQRGLKGDVNWFQEIYDEAINYCISEYVFDGLYTDEEIEDLIIMDEKEG